MLSTPTQICKQCALPKCECRCGTDGKSPYDTPERNSIRPDGTPLQRRPSDHVAPPVESNWCLTSTYSLVMAVVILISTVMFENVGPIVDEDLGTGTGMALVPSWKQTEGGKVAAVLQKGFAKIRTVVINVIRPVAERLPIGIGAGKGEQRLYSTAVTVAKDKAPSLFSFTSSGGGWSMTKLALFASVVLGFYVAATTTLANVKKATKTKTRSAARTA